MRTAPWNTLADVAAVAGVSVCAPTDKPVPSDGGSRVRGRVLR